MNKFGLDILYFFLFHQKRPLAAEKLESTQYGELTCIKIETLELTSEMKQRIAISTERIFRRQILFGDLGAIRQKYTIWGWVVSIRQSKELFEIFYFNFELKK